MTSAGGPTPTSRAEAGPGTPAPATDTLVVAIGQPLAGDDAVGLVVADRLRTLGIQSRTVPDGAALADLLSTAQRAILIDAVVGAGPPGTVISLNGDALVNLASSPGSQEHIQSEKGMPPPARSSALRASGAGAAPKSLAPLAQGAEAFPRGRRHAQHCGPLRRPSPARASRAGPPSTRSEMGVSSAAGASGLAPRCPGRFVLRTALQGAAPVSSHGISIALAVSIARALGGAEDVHLVGIAIPPPPPLRTSPAWSPSPLKMTEAIATLSVDVAAAVDTAVQRVRELLELGSR